MRLLALAVLTAFAIAACQGQAKRPANLAPASSSDLTDCRTIQHKMGKTEVCGQPQRIVALGPYVLEPLLALGIQPAGFADHLAVHQGDYDNPSQEIPYLGKRITQPLANVGLAYSPSIEALFKVQPDLILGTAVNADEYETFSKIAPTLLFNWAGQEQNLRAIGQAVNRSEQAEQLLTETAQQVVSTRGTFAPLVAEHPKVLLLVSSQFPEMYLGNSAGLCSSLITALGFQLVAPPKSGETKFDWRVPISLEALPQLNDADSVILLGSNSSELKQLNGTSNFKEHQLAKLRQAWESNAIAQSLNASKAGRVYFIPSYMCLGLPGSIGTQLYLNELRQQLLSPS